jgi:hypothetical protein
MFYDPESKTLCKSKYMIVEIFFEVNNNDLNRTLIVQPKKTAEIILQVSAWTRPTMTGDHAENDITLTLGACHDRCDLCEPVH